MLNPSADPAYAIAAEAMRATIVDAQPVDTQRYLTLRIGIDWIEMMARDFSLIDPEELESWKVEQTPEAGGPIHILTPVSIAVDPSSVPGMPITVVLTVLPDDWTRADALVPTIVGTQKVAGLIKGALFQPSVIACESA